MASKRPDRLHPPDKDWLGLAALRISEDFKEFVDSAADGIIVHQDDRVVYANAKALSQFGAADLDDLAEHCMLDFVAPDDRVKMRAFNHHLLSTGDTPVPMTFQRQQLDGTLIEVESSMVRANWQGRPALFGIIRTVDRRAQPHHLLEKNEKRLLGFLSTATNWLWETDAEHRFTMLSDELNDTGFKLPDVVGKTRWELAGVSPEQDDHWARHLADLDVRRPFRDFEYQNIGPNGALRYVSLSGVPIFDESDVFKGYRGTARDITERKRAELALEHLALHDPLTDLPNRRRFEDVLDRFCTKAKRQQKEFSVLFLDLDHFKDFNDIYGHDAGDRLLIEIGIRLRRCVNPAGLAARISGDEFAIIEPNSSGAKDMASRIDTIVNTIGQPYNIDGQCVPIQASIGIASYPHDAHSPSHLMRNADMALYQAKRHPERCWEYFRRAMSGEMQRRCTLENDLRLALEQQDLTMAYQPLIDLKSRKIVGVESLVRWHHPELGWVPPKSFVPIAEATGLIQPMGLWILRRVCQQAGIWRSIRPDLSMAINLSAMQLRHTSFFDDLKQIFAETEVEPHSIELELTESMLIETQHQRTKKTLERLADLGVRMSIDDFGTGYSSLSYLTRLPVQRIKLDQAFIRKIGLCSADEGIIKAVIAMGHSLNMSITAEGVETGEQVAFLEAENCDEAQGFYLGRPQSADAMGNLLLNSAKATHHAATSV